MNNRSDEYGALRSAFYSKLLKAVHTIADGSLWFTRYYFLIPDTFDDTQLEEDVSDGWDD